MASTIFHAPPRPCSAALPDYSGLKPSSPALVSVKFLQRPRSRSLLLVKASESAKKLGLTDAECEAAVVAGKIPEAPPVPPKPAAPAGTPLISHLVSEQINSIVDDL